MDSLADGFDRNGLHANVVRARIHAPADPVERRITRCTGRLATQPQIVRAQRTERGGIGRPVDPDRRHAERCREIQKRAVVAHIQTRAFEDDRRLVEIRLADHVDEPRPRRRDPIPHVFIRRAVSEHHDRQRQPLDQCTVTFGGPQLVGCLRIRVAAARVDGDERGGQRAQPVSVHVPEIDVEPQFLLFVVNDSRRLQQTQFQPASISLHRKRNGVAQYE
ncbi:Uncharacterised protein [Burkholderia pseudomallei]|nr:Uncharacterised protein [Burkholderia pseudomallei]